MEIIFKKAEKKTHKKKTNNNLPFTVLWANSANDKFIIFFLIFPRKQDLTFHAHGDKLYGIQESCFLRKNEKIFQYTYCLLRILPRVLSIQHVPVFLNSIWADWDQFPCDFLSKLH